MVLAVRENSLVLECINNEELYTRAKLSDKMEIFYM